MVSGRTLREAQVGLQRDPGHRLGFCVLEAPGLPCAASGGGFPTHVRISPVSLSVAEIGCYSHRLSLEALSLRKVFPPIVSCANPASHSPAVWELLSISPDSLQPCVLSALHGWCPHRTASRTAQWALGELMLQQWDSVIFFLLILA